MSFYPGEDQVGRLAARLHEEAEARIEEIRNKTARQLALRDATMATLKQELDSFRTQLQRTDMALHDEQAAHEQPVNPYKMPHG